MSLSFLMRKNRIITDFRPDEIQLFKRTSFWDTREKDCIGVPGDDQVDPQNLIPDNSFKKLCPEERYPIFWQIFGDLLDPQEESSDSEEIQIDFPELPQLTVTEQEDRQTQQSMIESEEPGGFTFEVIPEIQPIDIDTGFPYSDPVDIYSFAEEMQQVKNASAMIQKFVDPIEGFLYGTEIVVVPPPKRVPIVASAQRGGNRGGRGRGRGNRGRGKPRGRGAH